MYTCHNYKIPIIKIWWISKGDSIKKVSQENAIKSIYCTFMQSDQGLCCQITELLDTDEYTKE